MTYDADTLTIDLAILEARATAYLTHAVLLPMETRFGCQHPIHGTHGYFAGCADGGEGNKAILHTHIATTEKNGKEKGIGGMHAEVAVHEHMQNRQQFMVRYGSGPLARSMYDSKLRDLTKEAAEGAKKLSKADVKTLQTHQKALIKEAAALEKAGRSAAKQRAEATMIQRQLKRAGAVKTSKATTIVTPHKQLIPIESAGEVKIGRDDKPSAYVEHQIWGTKQLRDALSRYSPATLKEMITEVQSRHPDLKGPKYKNRDALVEFLYEHVSKDDGHLGPK